MPTIAAAGLEEQAPPLSQAEPWLVILLISLAALTILICATPPLLHFLGFAQYRWRVVEATELPLGTTEWDWLELRRQLEALGFQPVVVVEERLALFLLFWSRTHRSHTYLLKPNRCFASLFRVPAGARVSAALSTCFGDGSLVSTGTAVPQLVIRESHYYRTGAATDRMRELLDVHVAAVHEFLIKETPGQPSTEIATLGDASTRATRWFIQRQRKAAAMLFFLPPATILGLEALGGFQTMRAGAVASTHLLFLWAITSLALQAFVRAMELLRHRRFPWTQKRCPGVPSTPLEDEQA